MCFDYPTNNVFIFINSVQPDDHVDITIPVQVIEGQLLKISASWKSGYPEPWGNLSWNKILPGGTKLQPIAGVEMSGTVKTNEELCETIVDNFANFVPDLSWNGTEIIALPEFNRLSDVNVSPGAEVLFVVPGMFSKLTTPKKRVLVSYCK